MSENIKEKYFTCKECERKYPKRKDLEEHKRKEHFVLDKDDEDSHKSDMQKIVKKMKSHINDLEDLVKGFRKNEENDKIKELIDNVFFKVNDLSQSLK